MNIHPPIAVTCQQPSGKFDTVGYNSYIEVKVVQKTFITLSGCISNIVISIFIYNASQYIAIFWPDRGTKLL